VFEVLESLGEAMEAERVRLVERVGRMLAFALRWASMGSLLQWR